MQAMANLIGGFTCTMVYEGAFPGPGHAHNKYERVFDAEYNQL